MIAVGAVTPPQLLLILSCLATIFQAIDDPLSPRAAPGRCSRAPLQMVSRITRPALSRFSGPSTTSNHHILGIDLQLNLDSIVELKVQNRSLIGHVRRMRSIVSGLPCGEGPSGLKMVVPVAC